MSTIGGITYMDVSTDIYNRDLVSAFAPNKTDANNAVNAKDEQEKKAGIANDGISLNALKEQMKAIREQDGAAAKSYESWGKCIRIAMKIVKGDNVPPKDDNYLRENNPELHTRAWTMRVPKEDPEDHESELDDDEDGTAVKDMSRSISANTAEIPVPVSPPETAPENDG